MSSIAMGLLARRWLGLLLPWTVWVLQSSLGFADNRLPPPNFTVLSSRRNNTAVCQKLRFEAVESCREYAAIGLTEDDCQPWGQMTEESCLISNGNCTEITVELLLLCRVQLQNKVPNNELRLAYCMDSMFQLREYRCPPISYYPLIDNICYTPDPWREYYRGYTDEALQCMKDCGLYKDCYCHRILGTLRKDECAGPIYINKPLPGLWDPFANSYVSLGNYTCSGKDQPPKNCRHHIPEGMPCAKYKFCPVDMCVLNDIQCPNRTECEEVGDCDPVDGWCHYKNKPDKTPCDDGVYYTYGDQCIHGVCGGAIDYCLMYNISCVPESACLTGGTCNILSGRCVYEKLPDGTRCNDGREYTLEDRCQQGLCLGKVVNLCVERGVLCEAPSSCYDSGDCDPLTGLCSDPTPADDSRLCDDGDPTTSNETCIDGLCIGVPMGAKFEFLTLDGFGECSDRDRRRMGRYSGDVLEGEEGCLKQCLDDPQCLAYGYAFPLCSIYGTARNRAPPNSPREWAFELGTEPPAVAVETASPPAPGQRQTVCRKKGFKADVLKADRQFKIDPEVFFNFWIVLYFSLGLSTIFFCWPIVQAFLALLCPHRFAVREDIVEAVESPRKKERRRKKRRRRSEDEDSDEDNKHDSDEGKEDDLRAVANASASEADVANTLQQALQEDGGLLQPMPPGSSPEMAAPSPPDQLAD